MALDKNQKTSLALGIGVLVALALGIFLLGWVINNDSYNGYEGTKATGQNILAYSQPAKAATGSSYNSDTKKTTLGQSLKEQQYQNVPTVVNNIEININTPMYPKQYY